MQSTDLNGVLNWVGVYLEFIIHYSVVTLIWEVSNCAVQWQLKYWLWVELSQKEGSLCISSSFSKKIEQYAVIIGQLIRGAGSKSTPSYPFTYGGEVERIHYSSFPSLPSLTLPWPGKKSYQAGKQCRWSSNVVNNVFNKKSRQNCNWKLYFLALPLHSTGASYFCNSFFCLHLW